MTRRRFIVRQRVAAFTLIELMVVVAVILILSGITLMVVPGILDQDRTTDGAARLQQYLLVAKSRAARDNLPRGLRLINTGGFASEVQYIEAPPLYVAIKHLETIDVRREVFSLNAVPSKASQGAPFIHFHVSTDASGAITGQHIHIYNLDPSIEAQMAGGGSVLIPAMNVWFAFDPGGFDSSSKIVTPNALTGVSPYPEMGTGTDLAAYQFGIFGPPQPLLGEPVQQLPAEVGVDLGSCQGLPANQEVLFAPSGQVLHATSGHMFLWVRHRDRPGGNTGNLADYQSGGEQQIVAIRTHSGAISVTPVAWPPSDPFTFARQ